MLDLSLNTYQILINEYQVYCRASVLLSATLIFAGCVNEANVKSKNAPINSTSISNSNVFQHSVFEGLSQVCLPYMSTVFGENFEHDARVSISNLAGLAGFKEGAPRGWSHLPRFVYSIGDIGYETIVTASAEQGSSISRDCRSWNTNNRVGYPSVSDFTDWLKIRDHDWILIDDETKSYVLENERTSITKALYCKNQYTKYEQALKYIGYKRGIREGTEQLYIVEFYLIDASDRKCSGV